MDKNRNRFIENDDEPTRVIDLDERNIREDNAPEDDIDTLYEENESSVSEPTRVIEKQNGTKSSDRENARQEKIKEKNSKKLEKLMKKKRRREENSDREVLSYEDMPLEEREEPVKAEKPDRPKNRRFGTKRIIAAILIVIIVFGVVFFATNNDKLSWHNIRNFFKYGLLNQKSEEHFPVSIQGESVSIGNFLRMGQDICYASDTKLQIINNYGRLEYSAQHGFTNPVIAASKKHVLIYSLGGNGFQINNYEKTLYTSETDERIVVGDIIDNGTYALVTTSNGYLSKLQVYDKENEKIYGYSFADYYATAVSLAPNGKSAVVTGLSAHNGEEISSIYVLDFTKDKPTYTEEFTGNIFYDIKYLNDTYAGAVGNSLCAVINTKKGDVKETEYDGKHLTAYTFNRDTHNFSVSLSRSGDGRNCEILSFNTDGKLGNSFETEYMVKYISTYKGRVALLTPDMIYLYSKNGNKVSEKEVSSEPRAAVLYTTSDAYVLDTSEINSLRL